MRGLGIIFTLWLFISGCAPSKVPQSGIDAVFAIDGNPVGREEFIYNLKKNNYAGDPALSRAAIDEYLDLYINFKLKVHEARQLGLDTTKKFRDEYRGYKDQLTESYLKDDSVINALVDEAYQRLREEVSVSHILIRVSNFSDPSDTLKAYREIHRIYEKATEGEDFTELAVEYSEDPSVKINKGRLGFFKGLQMVYPFEEAAYETPVGGISLPFKTPFGYHILKVHDKRPSQGSVQVAHIMLQNKKNRSPQDSARIRDKIYTIYDSLTAGGDWDYFTARYSQDMRTRENGGVMSPFEAGRIVPSFSEAAFALEAPGDISEPVHTPYGWHIIKLIRKIPPGSFEELKKEIVDRVKQDSRSGLTREILIERLKKENHFRMSRDIRASVLAYADSSLLQGKWEFDRTDGFTESVLFTIANRNYTVGDLFESVETNQQVNRTSNPGVYMNSLIDQYIEDRLIEYEKTQLPRKHFDFKMLSQEYYEGILLFELMDRKVWSKAVEDTVGLEAFFRENRGRYRWPTRMAATVFRSDDLDVINRVSALLDREYYEIYDDSVLLGIAGGNIIPDNRMYLDSIYGLAVEDEEKKLMIALPAAKRNSGDRHSGDRHSGDLFDEFLADNDYDRDYFIPVNARTENLYVKMVSTGKKDLVGLINHNSGVNLQVEYGLYQKGDHEIIDLIDWEPGKHDVSIDEDEYLVHVEEVLSPMDQRLEEVRGKVISDYQGYLEKAWIGELRSKYEVNVNKKVLEEIYNEFETN